MGTKGEIRGYMAENRFTVYDFLGKTATEVRLDKPQSGHSGGDAGIIRNFLREVRSYSGQQGLTSAAASVQSHMMAFAAEHSRLHEGASVNLLEFMEQKKADS